MQRGRVVRAEGGHPAVSNPLEQRDGYGRLPGFAIRHGQPEDSVEDASIVGVQSLLPQVGGPPELGDRLVVLPELSVCLAQVDADGGLHFRPTCEPLAHHGGCPVQGLAESQIGVRVESATGLGAGPRLAQEVVHQEGEYLARDLQRGLRLSLFREGIGLGCRRPLARRVSASARSASACRASRARNSPTVVPMTPPTKTRSTRPAARAGPRCRRTNFRTR